MLYSIIHTRHSMQSVKAPSKQVQKVTRMLKLYGNYGSDQQIPLICIVIGVDHIVVVVDGSVVDCPDDAGVLYAVVVGSVEVCLVMRID